MLLRRFIGNAGNLDSERMDPKKENKMMTTGGILTKPTVYLVDDHPVVCSYLALLLETQGGLKVVGVSGNAEEAFEAILRLRPELTIIDLNLNGDHGMDLIRNLAQKMPQLKMLVFSGYEVATFASRVLQAGALGYVRKTAMPQEILEATRAVQAGQVYLSRQSIQESGIHPDEFRREPDSRQVPGRSTGSAPLSGRSPSAKSDPAEPSTLCVPVELSMLSDREFQVFTLIGEGRETRAIAEAMQVEVKTVETYRARIKVKLHLKSANELQLVAHDWVSHSHSLKPRST